MTAWKVLGWIACGVIAAVCIAVLIDVLIVLVTGDYASEKP